MIPFLIYAVTQIYNKSFLKLAVLNLFLFMPLFSQSIDPKYQYIKELLVARLTDQAQREIDRLSAEAPNDPTLNYYQTEVWYNKGETQYNSGNYSKALEYYDKASRFWTGNPLLSERIKNVKEKLKNQNFSNPTEKNKNIGVTSSNREANFDIPGLIGAKGQAHTINIFLLDKQTQEEVRLQMNEILDTTNSKESVSIPKAYLLYFSLLGFCLVVANIISITIVLRKNQNL